MSNLIRPLCVLALALTVPVGCFEFDNTSNVELREALEEVVIANQGEIVENEIIQITTDFTLGEAAQTIANNLRGFARHLRPGGRAIVGFGTDRGYAVSEFRAHVTGAGLQAELLLATWDLVPWTDDSDFIVAILRRAEVASG